MLNRKKALPCLLQACIAIVILLIACNAINKRDRYKKLNLIYLEAVKDAMQPEESEIDTSLISLNPQNKYLIIQKIGNFEYVLVVTWVRARSKYPHLGKFVTDSYIWVTVVPELKQTMTNVKIIDSEMRLRQLLGLPPDSNNKIFLEFYVKFNDLMRPCCDREINDKRCNLNFTKVDSLNMNHVSWINATKIQCFSEYQYSKYPWTQLGYTYDWNPDNHSHRGLSEFVVNPNSEIYINKIKTNVEYFYN